MATVLIARGDARGASKYFTSFDVTKGGPIPNQFEIHGWSSICLMLDDLPAAATASASYLTALHDSDSPVCHASAALAGYRILALDDERLSPDVLAVLRKRSADSLDRCAAPADGAIRQSFYGVWLSLAEALAAGLEGTHAETHLRNAVELANRFGSYVALEPRLLLAEGLLTHGERDEGRELLVAVWSDARAMGAGDHVRRATKLATRTRVPLPHDDAASTGPLARLTRREREVLDLLADGATNRDIAGALVISEKTASVHVSNVLAKLGVPNRGAAAALARQYA